MIRKAALFASLSLLASCSTPSAQDPPPAVSQPAPPKCDPRLEAEIRTAPTPPAGASIVQPATPEERASTAGFLTWVAGVLDVAQENEARARLARAECEKRAGTAGR